MEKGGRGKEGKGERGQSAGEAFTSPSLREARLGARSAALALLEFVEFAPPQAVSSMHTFLKGGTPSPKPAGWRGAAAWGLAIRGNGPAGAALAALPALAGPAAASASRAGPAATPATRRSATAPAPLAPAQPPRLAAAPAPLAPAQPPRLMAAPAPLAPAQPSRLAAALALLAPAPWDVSTAWPSRTEPYRAGEGGSTSPIPSVNFAAASKSRSNQLTWLSISFSPRPSSTTPRSGSSGWRP